MATNLRAELQSCYPAIEACLGGFALVFRLAGLPTKRRITLQFWPFQLRTKKRLKLHIMPCLNILRTHNLLGTHGA
jgi:hypothetical protein